MSFAARTSLCAAIVIMGSPLGAHPHVFVDAGLLFARDAQGRVVSVDVTWRYDELYTLILLQDYELDEDFDLVLTDDEIAQTLGFDLNWNGGFTGGLTLMQGDVTLPIGPPEAVSLTLLPSGQIETTHRRAILSAEPGGLSAQVYDHEFYIAFEMILPVAIAGAPECDATLIRADLDAAYAELDRAMDAIGGVIAAEDNFPPVGAFFADRVEITCPSS